MDMTGELLWYRNHLTRTLSVGESTIVLELRGAKFHSLNGLGANIWNVFAKEMGGVGAEKIVESLEQDLGQTIRDRVNVQLFLEKLADKNLISTTPWATVNSTIAREQLAEEVQQLPTAKDRKPLTDRLKVAAYLELLRCGFMLRKGYFSLRERLKPVEPFDPTATYRFDEITRCHQAILWAVNHFPYPARCLQQSSALTNLLRRRGIAARVVVGCEPMPFYSHAWVEFGPYVVNESATIRKRFKIIDHWG